MTEFEKKMLLTEEEYDYLMERLGNDEPLFPKSIVKQINYYFDTDDLSMSHRNITCRVRFKDGKYKATMKSHFENGDQSTETEMEIRDGIRDNAFIDMDLKLQGELTTYRCIILKENYCEVVLDRNEYLGHIDYELEIEYLSEYEKDAQTIYHAIFDMLARRKCFLVYKESLKKTPDVSSKSSRFFEMRKKMDENKNIDRPSRIEESTEKDVAPVNEAGSDYSDSDAYMEKNIYDYFTMCMSCQHWNGYMCNAENGSCGYEPF